MMTSQGFTARGDRELLLQQLLEAEAGIDSELMTFSDAGDRLVLHGCIGSYALKVRAEKLAREAGFRDVENCLRVAPGVVPCMSSTSSAPRLTTIERG